MSIPTVHVRSDTQSTPLLCLGEEGDVGGMQLFGRVERILFVAGSALLAVYSFTQVQNYMLSRSALATFEELPQAAVSSLTIGAADRVSIRGLDMSLWSRQRIRAYEASLTNQFAPPLGILRIPKVGLVVPILEGTDDLMLNIGVGRIHGTARVGETGNIGIAGHRDGFFRGLKDIAVGDNIELNTPRETLTYAVDQIEIVQPENVEVLHDRGHASLTLVTCFPFYYVGHAPERYIVHAALKANSQRAMLSPHQLLVSESNKENPQ